LKLADDLVYEFIKFVKGYLFENFSPNLASSNTRQDLEKIIEIIIDYGMKIYLSNKCLNMLNGFV